jgi:hypothetical protein
LGTFCLEVLFYERNNIDIFCSSRRLGGILLSLARERIEVRVN